MTCVLTGATPGAPQDVACTDVVDVSNAPPGHLLRSLPRSPDPEKSLNFGLIFFPVCYQCHFIWKLLGVFIPLTDPDPEKSCRVIPVLSRLFHPELSPHWSWFFFKTNKQTNKKGRTLVNGALNSILMRSWSDPDQFDVRLFWLRLPCCLNGSFCEALFIHPDPCHDPDPGADPEKSWSRLSESCRQCRSSSSGKPVKLFNDSWSRFWFWFRSWSRCYRKVLDRLWCSAIEWMETRIRVKSTLLTSSWIHGN